MRDRFPPMWQVVPEGTHGVALVKHFTVDREASQMTALRGGRSYVPEGRYAQLKVRGEMVMSDTRYERQTNSSIVYRATGRVLVAGYGLGMILTAILRKDVRFFAEVTTGKYKVGDKWAGR